ncbi:MULTISPECIES: FAD-dependent thymidylate synthase [unclassified Kosmotoga]|uniref:FAD-dependent thymidylate synthase n=1 Tax=unclassified Kosmotoga TaxID=2631489 RepID=UPI0007C4873F|nr:MULTISPECIES: FAD-dependent thymidylate synthase [unclassified Kosmotoga]MDI3524491.1 thymidylate synthase [Kosmotoga sp.]OAA25545.1 thymidylate synthase [Kosmotoga sp. DU53]
MEIKVLEKGFVRLVEVMGDDFSAVQAARVSYGKGLTTPERDKKLIFYLMEHGHHSPFEHIIFKFHIKLPIFVMRQLVRHRIASINERSGRYTEFSDEWYIPERIRTPDKVNRQGSVFVDDDDLNSEGIRLIEKTIEKTYQAYKRLLEMGVARELARIVLPTSMYTECYWTINARSMMNFLNLRADSHAQYEMQQYALAVAKIFKSKCPVTYEAFLNFAYTGDLLKTEGCL